MQTSIWVEDPHLQEIFDLERTKISSSQHPLAINYSSWFDKKEIIAYTMTWDSDKVYLCSTIGRKEYWPKGTYRVLNRLFKGDPEDVVTKHINHFWMDHVEQQINFLKNYKGFKTAIISRKQGYQRALTKFQQELLLRNLEFKLSPTPVWVCNDCNNPECLQDILYYGKNVLGNFIY
jgi:hypothetical protein